MFKRQASVHNKLAATIVSALFLSLSAHAGLLGAGGVSTGATGASGGLVGGMTGRLGVATPMPTGAANAAAAAAAQASTQNRVQALLPAPIAGSVQQAGQLGANGVGRVDNGALAGQAGAALTGQATAGQAVAGLDNK